MTVRWNRKRVERAREQGVERWRRDGDHAPLADRAIWNWVTSRGVRGDGREPFESLHVLPADKRAYLREYRVLFKAASGGGFLVPSDVAETIAAAARAS